MTDVFQKELVSDAKRHRFSTIPKLTDEDVVSVWDNVASFVEQYMSNQKGVHIAGLGTFTFTQKKLDIGNNKFILIQRPVFVLSEKFAQTHGLNYTKHFTSGQIPIVELNFSTLSSESPFDRDTIEGCIKEVLQALARSVKSRRNVEFTFTGIGRLTIRDSKVKMKFYKDFLNMMDGSGTLAEALRNRADTADSVLSRASTCRPLTGNTLVLPRITQGAGKEGFAPDTDLKTQQPMATINEDTDMQCVPEECLEPKETQCDTHVDGETKVEIHLEDVEETKPELVKKVPSRTPSRQVIPTATAVGISFTEDLVPIISTPPRGIRGSGMVPSPPNSKPPSPPVELPSPRSPTGSLPTGEPAPTRSPKGSLPPMTPDEKRVRMANDVLMRAITPPDFTCCHNDVSRAGQELCYLCHQRASRNIPVSFDAERKRKEQEQDRLLQQYQHFKDTEKMIKEQAQHFSNRHHNQKIAAFNLGVSEAIKGKKSERPISFHRSYIFQNRAITPPRHIKQEQYADQLSGQVEAKTADRMKRMRDTEFLERLEQVQLAEELAAQREQYLRDKATHTESYQRALSAQIHIRDRLAKLQDQIQEEIGGAACGDFAPRISSSSQRRLLGPLSLPVPKIILPFNKTEPLRLKMPDSRTVRFKPLPLPSAVSDSSEPIFGKYDATNEQLADKRCRAIEVYKEQLLAVENARKDKLLNHLKHQQEESAILEKTRRELISDRAARYENHFSNRKSLEEDWRKAASLKSAREEEYQLCAQTPGLLLHEQCDKYNRCDQCQRRVFNCGESNIWSESRYIPGSRLMV